MSSIYQEQLNWAKQRGLFLDPRIERKCVDGVWGLFATDDIPAGTKLISYPVAKSIKNFSDDIYPENTPQVIKNMHRAAVEYAKGEKSEYYGHFLQFESLDVYKEISTFFYDEKEMELLQSMSATLVNVVGQLRNLASTRVAVIQKLEPDLDPDIILLIVLNYASRAWDDSNFLPIIDYANHSDRLGQGRTTKNNEHVLDAKVNYKKGDQIFLSYGRKDMYVHAISYNYFDPTATHYMQYGVRFVQMARSAVEIDIAKYTATLFPLKVTQHEGHIEYACLDPDVCFLETGPSLKLLEYIRSNYYPTVAEWKNKHCSSKSLEKRMLEILNFMLSTNHVDKFSLEELPPKFHRFYHMLKKEQAMLEKNKEWVIDNFYL